MNKNMLLSLTAAVLLGAGSLAMAPMAVPEVKTQIRIAGIGHLVSLARIMSPSMVQIKATVITRTIRKVSTRVDKPIMNRQGRIVTYKTTQTRTRITTVTRVNGGSGVILDRRGDIVTNAHVVYHAKTIRVTLADHQKFNAILLGMDQRSDLAVIRIKGSHLRPAKLGASSRLAVGQRVLDFGAPFNFAGSVTQGIISALHRRHISVTGETDPHLNMIRHEDYIQTDAPSDPGSSGGALVNMDGEVIGINDSIKSGGAGSFSGVAFAIPSDEVAYVVRKLIAHGHVVHGHAGIQAISSFARIKNGGGTKVVDGIKITAVKKGGSGSAAGIKVGDVITAIDGRWATSAPQLLNRIMFSAPGTHLHLTLLRAGHRVGITLTVGGKGRHRHQKPSAPNRQVRQPINGEKKHG